MLRRMLLAASDSDRARQLLVSAPLARSVVARYVAGDLAPEAVEVAGKLVSAGLLVTLDHLGEDTGDARQAAAVGDEYVALLKLLAGHLDRLGRQVAGHVPGHNAARQRCRDQQLSRPVAI